MSALCSVLGIPSFSFSPWSLPRSSIDCLDHLIHAMAYLKSLLASALLLSTATAHFQLISPPSLPGAEDQATAPCGGGKADLSQNTATDFHVDGQHVQLFLGHAQGTWLIRATLDDKAAGNWTQVFPIFQQSGRGNFCEPAVTVPQEWAGKKGFIGLNSNAGDGILYLVRLDV